MELRSKKTILIFIDWYLPGYKAGGPIKSISSIVEYLKSDFNFLIITSDKDFGETSSYESIRTNVWNQLNDSVSVFYASDDFISIKNLLKLLRSIEFDLVYLNSFFSIKYSLFPLVLFKTGRLKKPLLLAPRGMLGEGALRIKSTKKKLFILFSKLLSIHKNIHWHATSVQEQLEIHKQFGRSEKIDVVPNLQFFDRTKKVAAASKTKKNLKLFFLSRISEKKNLLSALRILSTLKNDDSFIEYNIIGPIEDTDYWEKCRTIIGKMPANIRVTYEGAIENALIFDKISDYHFLFLPTYNENYGHVIVESFLAGKPVIISDQTPWRNLKENHVGWDIALNDEIAFAKAINECIGMEDSTYSAMSQSAVKYALNNCLSLDSVNKTKDMFNDTLKSNE